VQRGSLAQLRLYNRPAILMLSDDGGGAHQVVLSGLDDEQARIELGSLSQKVGIAELSRYWFGDFVLLWKPDAPGNSRPLSVGMHGEAVRHLRESLQRLAGAPAPATPPSDVFDADLGRLVRDFQRAHRLQVDGVAGIQTMVVLNSATAGANSPLLQGLPSHGS